MTTALAFCGWAICTLVIDGPGLVAELWRHGLQRGDWVDGVYTRAPGGPPWWRR